MNDRGMMWGKAFMSDPEAMAKFRFGEAVAFMNFSRGENLELSKTLLGVAVNSRDSKTATTLIKNIYSLQTNRPVEKDWENSAELCEYLFDEKVEVKNG